MRLTSTLLNNPNTFEGGFDELIRAIVNALTLFFALDYLRLALIIFFLPNVILCAYSHWMDKEDADRQLACEQLGRENE